MGLIATVAAVDHPAHADARRTGSARTAHDRSVRANPDPLVHAGAGHRHRDDIDPDDDGAGHQIALIHRLQTSGTLPQASGNRVSPRVA